MKIFELKWNNQNESEWIAASTNIEALLTYFKITGMDLFDLDDVDEIIEIPETEWPKYSIKNIDYNPEDPEDSESETFEEYMKGCVSPDIICGTMYE